MTDRHPDPASDGWHFDRRIPIALVLTILIQTAGAVWWLSSLNSRVTSLEEKIGSVASQPERLVRVETQVEQLTKTMDRIERKLDRALDPSDEP